MALGAGAISLQWTGGDCFAEKGLVMGARCAVYSDGKEEKDRIEFNSQQLARQSGVLFLFSGAPV